MIRMSWIRFACVTVFVIGLVRAPAASGASAVEELTRRMPDDVVAYVGTSGGDALKGDFEKTILGRIWNDQGVQTFWQAIKTELIAKAGQESDDPNIAQEIDLVLDDVRLAISRPMLLGISQIKVEDGPAVRGFAILDAGDRKAEFAAAVGKLEAMIGLDEIVDRQIGSFKMRSPKNNDDWRAYWGWIGSYFVIAVDDAQGEIAKYVSQPRAAVPAYLGKLPANGDALVAHYDWQKISRLIDDAVRDLAAKEEVSRLTAALAGLGLSELKSGTVRVGFAGSDLVVQGRLEMPAPTKGLFAACRPVDLSWLRAVDVRAVTASVFNWDLAAVYDTIMNAVKTASPDEAYPEIRNAIAGFESEAGLAIRNDLLASLEGPGVSYVVPAGAMPEAPMGGFVVVAKLKDVGSFEKALTALGQFAGEKAEGMLQVSSLKRDEGRTVHTWTIAPLAMAGIMPAWSVANDHVVVGSNIGLCDRGVEQLVSKAAGAKSLLDAEGFKKVAGQLPGSLTGFTYTDSQVQLTQTMMQLQQFWPMATMMAMQGEFKLPVMLPSLTHIAKDMGPSCSYSYYGSDGLYSYHRGPGIEISLGAVAGGAIGAGIAMPALARVRQLSFRMTSGTNLSGIGRACLIYAEDHDDKLPPDLQTLVGQANLSAKALESKLKPKDFEGPSYIYVPGQNVSMYPGNVVAYDNPEFCTEGVNVLFLDTHVEFMKPEAFRQELKATYTRLKRPLPKIRFRNETEAQPPVESSQEEDSRVSTTQRRLRMVHTALNEFHMDTGRWPTEDEGLMVLVKKPANVTNWKSGGYVASRELLKDGWGHDFVLELYPESGKPFIIKSLGRDGKEGGSGYDADMPPSEPPVDPSLI